MTNQRKCSRSWQSFLIREVTKLRRWKNEATPLLEDMARIHELLPPEDQAPLGSGMTDAIEAYVRRSVGGIHSSFDRGDR
jgi:hypothetical protein